MRDASILSPLVEYNIVDAGLPTCGVTGMVMHHIAMGLFRMKDNVHATGNPVFCSRVVGTVEYTAHGNLPQLRLETS